MFHLTLHGDNIVCFTYPQGELQVRFKGADVPPGEDIVITARMKDASDVMELALLRDAVDTFKPKSVSLILPYLPYGRADRRFTDHDCEGLAVFGRMLFAMSFRRIVTFDAHNRDAAVACIPGLVNVAAEPWIEGAILDFAQKGSVKRVCVLFPDEGASNRYDIADVLGNNHNAVEVESVFATKKRDVVTGKFLGFDVPKLPQLPVIVVDDICDGGGTFVGIAQHLRAHVSCLFTSHGIYSQGLNRLYDAGYSYVWSTDTVLGHGHFNVDAALRKEVMKELKGACSGRLAS